MNKITDLRQVFVAVARVLLVMTILFSGIALAPNSVARASSTKTSKPAGFDTSAFLIGKVAVGVIFPESTGAFSTEPNWTPTEKSNAISEIQQGLDRWSSLMTSQSSGKLSLTFTLDDVNQADNTNFPETVAVTHEPINMGSSLDAQQVWINEALGSYAYDPAHPLQQQAKDRMYSYINQLRNNPSVNADWGFVIFVVHDSNVSNHKFTTGDFFYSDLYGPYTVVTYDAGPLGNSNLDLVISREVAHIFGASYHDACLGTSMKFGYLAIADSNCNIINNSLMDPLPTTGGVTPAANPDSVTLQQVGWVDSDGDKIFDPVDTKPVVSLTPYTNPTYNTQLVYYDPIPESYSSPIHIKKYKVYDTPYAAVYCPAGENCYSQVLGNVSFTINTISSVEFQVDGGTWQAAIADNGAFDTDYEFFNFTTPTLASGQHIIAVRATNSVGNVSDIVKDTVNIIGDATNNNYMAPKDISSSLPFSEIVNILNATVQPADPVTPSCNGNRQGLQSVWYTFTDTSATPDPLYLDTLGSDYDTYIAVWTYNGSTFAPIPANSLYNATNCNDDLPGAGSGPSKFVFLPAQNTTYYIEVAKYGDPSKPLTSGGELHFRASGPAAIKVYIGTSASPVGSYKLNPSESARVNYAGVNNGPLRIVSTGGIPIIAALRDAWWNGSAWTSFAQLMGLPASQVSDTYYFPAYNNISLDEQLRLGNVGTANTTVTVTIGGLVKGTYFLHPNESARVNYAGVNSGPVIVKSSDGVPIIAAERDAWQANGVLTSFVQLMGLPASQLSDTYYFPAYNNISLDEQLRFGNVGIADTTVTVTIGGQVKGTYFLHPNESARVNYAGVNSGPVVVQSSDGVPIIAAERDAWQANGVLTCFAQTMGLPVSQVSDTYVFPAYNNISLDEQLRFGNVGTADTTVTVTIGGQPMGSYFLHPSESARVNYAGVNSGPVVVKSSGNVSIIAAERDAWQANGVLTSFVQTMGLPANQLSDTYVFPAYNNISLDEQLRFGVP